MFKNFFYKLQNVFFCDLVSPGRATEPGGAPGEGRKAPLFGEWFTTWRGEGSVGNQKRTDNIQITKEYWEKWHT